MNRVGRPFEGNRGRVEAVRRVPKGVFRNADGVVVVESLPDYEIPDENQNIYVGGVLPPASDEEMAASRGITVEQYLGFYTNNSTNLSFDDWVELCKTGGVSSSGVFLGGSSVSSDVPATNNTKKLLIVAAVIVVLFLILKEK